MESCSYAYPNYPFGPRVSFSIWAPSLASGQARLYWILVLGGVGRDTDSCGVFIPAHMSFETQTQTVPLAKLLSSDPQTFTFAGSKHFDHDDLGRPASIDHDWKLSLTVQRR